MSTLLQQQENVGPIPAPKLPLQTRIRLLLYLCVGKTFTKVVFGLYRFFKPLPPSQRPAILKTYPIRPHLTHRIFMPHSPQKNTLLPLCVTIHLGGFVMRSPFWDDEYCAHFSSTYNILVISLDYSKAPSDRFPVQPNEIIATVQAILSDSSLPVDKSCVVIGGVSAGGNLALSASQAPELKGRIHGAVCWCSTTDWTTSTADKLKSRPYRNAKDADVLKDAAAAFSWAYIQPGQNLRDPKLSVCFAKREDLPKWLFLIGEEYDALCRESKEMIMNLAELEGKEREEGNYEFEKGTIKWKMARGMVHGFTHYIPGESAVDKEVRLKMREETFAEVGEWLFKGPFSRVTPK